MAHFRDFDADKWYTYYTSLNDGLPADKCPLKLSDDEKEAYTEALNELMTERKKHPGVPLFYPTTFETDW